MSGKQWRSCRFMINGLAHKVQYNEETIQELFLPFLRQMSRKQKALKRRLIVLLAAPPGTGKSTLCLLLEKLSQSMEGLVSLQALGLDGFHHTAAYLRSHKIEQDVLPDGDDILNHIVDAAVVDWPTDILCPYFGQFFF